jgi:phage terminase large subunit-like protein
VKKAAASAKTKKAPAIVRALSVPTIPREPVPLYPFCGSVMELKSAEDYIPPAALSDPLGYGEQAWQVCSRMPVPTHPGKRLGDMSAPWFERMVRAVYGTVYDDGTGPRRQIRRVVLIAGKKTGKSTSAAALTLSHNIIHSSQFAQTLILAPTREATHHVFQPISFMVGSDPVLERRFRPQQYVGRIKDNTTNGVIRVAAFELAATTGTTANLLVIDEAHLMVKPAASAIVAQAQRGQIVHREPLEWVITTMPVDMLRGPLYDLIHTCWSMWKGEVDDRETLFLPFSLPDEVDLDDRSQWWRANPNIGRTVELSRLSRDWDRAKIIPSDRAFFISQIFNKDPSAEAGAARWMGLGRWMQNADYDLDIDAILETCDHVWCGVDIGGLEDCTALAVIGLHTDQFGIDHWKVSVKQWVSRETFEAKRGVVPYDDFVASGELVVFDEAMDDVSDIVDLVSRIDDSGKLCCVAIDSYQLREVQTRLMAVLDGEDVIIAVPQGWRLQPAILWLERQLKARTLHHPGTPMLSWNVCNATLERRGNARTISKATTTSSLKIDGLAALITGAAAASQKINVERSSTGAGIVVI